MEICTVSHKNEWNVNRTRKGFLKDKTFNPRGGGGGGEEA